MANIQKLTYPYFTDGTTPLNAANLNSIIAKLNEVIDQVNSGVTPTPTQTVATPTISISGTTATISCSTSGATIRYAIDGTPTESSGTIIANGGTVNLSSYNTQKTIRAIAYKSGMTTSQVGQATYTPAAQPDEDATAIMARYSKSLTSAQQSAFNTFIVGLKNAGIYDKIVYMVVPVIANNLTEATQNALTGESAFYNSITSSDINFANNAISPVVGGTKAQAKTIYGEDTQFENRNFHLSGYNVNVLTDTEYNEAQDLLFGGGFIEVGKSLEKGRKAGVRYFTEDNENAKVRLETSADTSVCKNKNHIVASFDTEKVIFSINGTSNVSDQPVIDYAVYQPKRPRLGEQSRVGSENNYTNPTSVELSIGGASRCKYGFLSWGFALTEAQCIAFNTCVETMMQAFV